MPASEARYRERLAALSRMRGQVFEGLHDLSETRRTNRSASLASGGFLTAHDGHSAFRLVPPELITLASEGLLDGPPGKPVWRCRASEQSAGQPPGAVFGRQLTTRLIVGKRVKVIPGLRDEHENSHEAFLRMSGEENHLIDSVQATEVSSTASARTPKRCARCH